MIHYIYTPFMEWITIAIVTAIIGAVVTAVFGGVAWLMSRVVAGFDEKIDGIEEKLVSNSVTHYEKAEAQGNRITRLEAIEECRGD